MLVLLLKLNDNLIGLTLALEQLYEIIKIIIFFNRSILSAYVCLLFVFLALQPIVVVFSQPPRVRGFLITHNDAPHSVGLLWTSDQSVAETST
jgi:hypothetical protein